MARGRKPLAAEVHRQKGSYAVNPQRENKRAPNVKYVIPDPPESLEGLEYGSKKWDQLVGVLSELKVLAETDADLLEMYCVSYQFFREALTAIRRDGMTLKESTKSGELTRRNPVCTELHQHVERLGKLMTEMGLTPSSRTRLIASPEPEVSDGLAALLKNRSLN